MTVATRCSPVALRDLSESGDFRSWQILLQKSAYSWRGTGDAIFLSRPLLWYSTEPRRSKLTPTIVSLRAAVLRTICCAPGCRARPNFGNYILEKYELAVPSLTYLKGSTLVLLKLPGHERTRRTDPGQASAEAQAFAPRGSPADHRGICRWPAGDHQKAPPQVP